MQNIHVDIVSVEGHIHSGEARLVVAPAEMGEVGIAPRHAPLLTQLRAGEVRVNTPDGQTLRFFVGGGMLEVQPYQVTILADSALRGADADEVAAVEAKRQAEDAMKNAASEMDLARAQADLVEAAARLEFVRKIKGNAH